MMRKVEIKSIFEGFSLEMVASVEILSYCLVDCQHTTQLAGWHRDIYGSVEAGAPSDEATEVNFQL